ncbi:ABC transporter permease subunit [Natrarchaeobius oligotrophus]|uniref:ABC transporter permease n=1 Tax=Natrarchaeobius chitinivorans TaxID=1679083 RepID=A0A3N6MEU9_NATCH|nr:ABC transporter permease subunit [Natrarchaeobius chitinivorans]RQG99394.1 ABC transporter permease [Natrarchaeobius chitinivorans]
MFETTRYEMGRRVRGTAILTVAIGLYAAFIVWYFTVLEGVDYDQMLESMPPAMMDAFGIETLATIEGFLGSQIYSFVWLLGLGLYFAYAAGGLVANDAEHDRLDLLLSFPVSRSRLLLEKVASLFLPLIALNVGVGATVYVLAAVIGEPIDVANLALAHALSVPYLLVCAGIGLVLSVLVDRAAVAERAAIGVVFVLFLLESVVGGADELEWIQYLSPTYYYEPTPVLIDGSYEPIDAAILLTAFVGLVIVATVLFDRRDV